MNAVEQGYDPAYGARPLKRDLQHTVETLLARMIIANSRVPNTQLEVAVMEGRLSIGAK